MEFVLPVTLIVWFLTSFSLAGEKLISKSLISLDFAPPPHLRKSIAHRPFFPLSPRLTLKATPKATSWHSAIGSSGNGSCQHLHKTPSTLLQAKLSMFRYKLPVSLSQSIFFSYLWSQWRRYCCWRESKVQRRQPYVFSSSSFYFLIRLNTHICCSAKERLVCILKKALSL